MGNVSLSHWLRVKMRENYELSSTWFVTHNNTCNGMHLIASHVSSYIFGQIHYYFYIIKGPDPLLCDTVLRKILSSLHAQYFSPSFKYLIVVTTSKHEELIRSYQANIFTKFYLCWNFSSHKIIFFYDVFLTFYHQNNHYCEFRPFDSHLIYLLCYKLIF